MFTVFRTVVCCAFAAGLVAGCGDSKSPSSPTPGPPPTSLNVIFDVAHGQSHKAEGNAFTVRFDRVTEDSRCGAAQSCIAGKPQDVTVELSAAEGSGQTQTVTLSSDPARRTAQVGRLTVALETVSPYPVQSPRDIPTDAYRATLRVTRP